jgi:hypothetical protein
MTRSTDSDFAREWPRMKTNPEPSRKIQSDLTTKNTKHPKGEDFRNPNVLDGTRVLNGSPFGCWMFFVVMDR